MTSDLTIVCITKVEPHAREYLTSMVSLGLYLHAPVIFGLDGDDAFVRLGEVFNHANLEYVPELVRVQSKGYLESVHDEVVEHVRTKYVLRLDDDEGPSGAMIAWLYEGKYREADHWKFPRANMWTSRYFIKSPHLWPDVQTRLSVKEKALGRNNIHCGSPHGGGRLAPVAIQHWKFFVKDYEERLKIAKQYDKVMSGAGTGGMRPFNLPEDCYDELPLEEWSDDVAVG